jgi:hypothetical protein
MTLFPDYVAFARYRYSAFITNMNLPAELIWEIYRKRADAENQIKAEVRVRHGEGSVPNRWPPPNKRSDG